MFDPLHIAFVEDDADVRIIVELALKLDPNIRFRTFATGEDALAAMVCLSKPFDLGLFDVKLPGINGLELALQARKIRGQEQLRIIFLTANFSDPHVQNFEGGQAGVIGKPFDVVALPREIRRLFREL